VLARRLAAIGLTTLRGEAFDVRATPEGRVLAKLDRGALPAFGIAASGIHLNGIVRRTDGLYLWLGVRARDKAVAPGKLDNLVAGGTPAGHDAWSTLLKEAAEEASLPHALAARARQTGRITYTLWTPQGLRRDTLHCFDLDLPEGFVPLPGDGEVERFELWPIERVFAAVRDSETVKFNVNLVLIDLFLREGLIDPASAEGQRLRAGLNAGP
jgi:8-oxo-dGTP pyrophosphatase MutT (NUDIX family)